MKKIDMSPMRLQSGYMIEIPLLMLAAGIMLAIALPRVSLVLAKVLMSMGTLVWIGGLYYMIVVPGWQPGNTSSMRRVWRLVLFLALSGFLFFIAGAYVLGGKPPDQAPGMYQ